MTQFRPPHREDASPGPTDALPEGYVVHLPPPRTLPPKPHEFGPSITILGELSVSGHEQHERTCKVCGAVRVTIIDKACGVARRAWRTRAFAGGQVETFMAPRCEAA